MAKKNLQIVLVPMLCDLSKSSDDQKRDSHIVLKVFEIPHEMPLSENSDLVIDFRGATKNHRICGYVRHFFNYNVSNVVFKEQQLNYSATVFRFNFFTDRQLHTLNLIDYPDRLVGIVQSEMCDIGEAHSILLSANEIKSALAGEDLWTIYDDTKINLDGKKKNAVYSDVLGGFCDYLNEYIEKSLTV